MKNFKALRIHAATDGVEIRVHLPAGAEAEKISQQLYVFTNCQLALSPAACVIEDDKPHFLGVREILKRTERVWTSDCNDALERQTIQRGASCAACTSRPTPHLLAIS